MKKFNDIRELNKNWFTTKELFQLLKKRGYPHNVFTLREWEKSGTIPQPKKIAMRGNIKWRVYSKDGKDFEEIFKSLKGRTSKVVSSK